MNEYPSGWYGPDASRTLERVYGPAPSLAPSPQEVIEHLAQITSGVPRAARAVAPVLALSALGYGFPVYEEPRQTQGFPAASPTAAPRSRAERRRKDRRR